MLKVYIRESHIDTNATSSHIRTQLSSLDDHMAKLGNNIDKFNQYVKTLLEGLATRGETSNDTLCNLFKGCKAASDQVFVKYIESKEKEIPMASSRILMRHTESTPFDNSFHYRRVIGQMNYLEKGSRSDIA